MKGPKEINSGSKRCPWLHRASKKFKKIVFCITNLTRQLSSGAVEHISTYQLVGTKFDEIFNRFAIFCNNLSLKRLLVGPKFENLRMSASSSKCSHATEVNEYIA